MTRPVTKSAIPMFLGLLPLSSWKTRLKHEWPLYVILLLSGAVLILGVLLADAIQKDFARNEMTERMFREFLADPKDSEKFDEVLKALESGNVDTKTLTRALVIDAHHKALSR